MEQLTIGNQTRQLPLLRTKLNIPRARSNAVVRQHLLDKLNAAIDEGGHIRPKLTLITAPAGYGKTTLAAQWVQQLGRPVAWVSLDESENDIGRFLAYLFSAIGSANEPLVTDVLSRLTSGYTMNSAEAMLTTLLNDIDTSPHCLAIAFDDYHLIDNTAVHAAVAYLLEHAPANLHLIISSRSEPQLPVATLRAQNAVQSITAHDLRLTLDECRHFITATMALPLADVQVTQLDEQTEGWAAGLQLATLALQDGGEIGQAFSGNQRYVVDYLAEQVLGQQSAEIRTFLLKSSILKQFNADLCEQVTGLSNCQRLLEQLDSTNLFLVPLDGERGWYRYHHLFAEFLQGRLATACDDAGMEHLHLEAARWYHEQGLASEAIEHALAAGAFGFSAELLQDIARRVLMFGEGALLRRWLESLPDELLANNPQLGLIYGWTLVRTGNVGAAYKLTETLAPQLDEVAAWRGEWAALRARVASFKGWTEKSVKFSNKALAHLASDQHGLRSEVAINLGFSHLAQTDLEAAQAAFTRAAQPLTDTLDLWSTMFATFYSGQTHSRQAQLHEAFGVFERGYQLAIDLCSGQQRMSPAVGFMHLGMGEVLLQWNRLAEAQQQLETALALGERGGDVKMLGYGLTALTKLYMAQGNVALAEQMIGRDEARYQQPQPSFWRARLALRTGDTEILQRWEANRAIGVGDSAEKITNSPGDYFTLAMWRTMQSSYAGVPALFERLLSYATSHKNSNYYLHILVQQAIMFAKMGAGEQAAESFQRALTLAEPQGYVRLFLDGDAALLMRLLHQAAGGVISAEYARTLLTHCDASTSIDPPTLPNPLSPREFELLTHLAAGLTNRQVAERMVVSINTVKAHCRRLYEKLDVHSRSQAVAQARDLKLL